MHLRVKWGIVEERIASRIIEQCIKAMRQEDWLLQRLKRRKKGNALTDTVGEED